MQAVMDVSSRIVLLEDKVALLGAFSKPPDRMSGVSWRIVRKKLARFSAPDDMPFEQSLELGLVLSFIDG
jgi:hypothetical protein